MKIGIIGGGTVGAALAKSLCEYCTVKVFDVEATRRTHGEKETLASDLVFLCLPTPSDPLNGGITTAILDGYLHRLSAAGQRHLTLVVKSTVPIGWTRAATERTGLTILHSPEFLTARTAFVDACIPTVNIVGTPQVGGAGERNDLNVGATTLTNFYLQRWPHVLLMPLTSDESEAVKLCKNSLFASTIAIWNEFKAFLDKIGVDFETVRRVLLLDGRISPSHSMVPGPDGKPGFGGECLPKDAAELLKEIKAAQTVSTMVMGALVRNAIDRDPSYIKQAFDIISTTNPTLGSDSGQSS